MARLFKPQGKVAVAQRLGEQQGYVFFRLLRRERQKGPTRMDKSFCVVRR